LEEGGKLADVAVLDASQIDLVKGLRISGSQRLDVLALHALSQWGDRSSAAGRGEALNNAQRIAVSPGAAPWGNLYELMVMANSKTTRGMDPEPESIDPLSVKLPWE
jgi:hypothetical protein